MKTRAVLFSLLLLAFGSPALGQYSIGWWTIDGGGGISTGGVYAVTGTIGQPDAGVMGGGSFALEGGFWSIVAIVPAPGAPLLSITRTNTNVIVSWPAPAEGWVLGQTNRLSGLAGPWPLAPFPYVTNATDIRVIVPITPGSLFLRLYKP
jgi:hypothetical protein